MNKLMSCCAVALFAVAVGATSADAFSRRPSPSEVSQPPLQKTTLAKSGTEEGEPNVQRVPEPSPVWLLGIGIGFLLLLSVRKRFAK